MLSGTACLTQGTAGGIAAAVVMSQKSRLLDLVVAWEDLRAAGREVSPAELCRDCPELTEALEARLRAPDGMNAALGTGQPAADGWPGRTEVLTQPPAACGPANPAWPVIPHYEILEELGRGGMGVVLKARQTALGRIVAVKAILPHGPIQEDQRRRFLREAKAMALLQHPNIVQIYEVSQQGEHPYLIMEYVEGRSLSDSLAEKPLPSRQAAELVAVLARAVHACARARRRPSRSEAQQHPPGGRRHAEDLRFRPGQAFCQHGRPDRDQPVSPARPATWRPSKLSASGSRKARRWTSTPWGPCSTNAHRAAALPGRESHGDAAAGASSSSRSRRGSGSPRRLATWRRSA